MNECEKYREMISAMLDGELDNAGSERLIKHMSSCAECRELYDMLSAVSDSDVWKLPETPEGLHGRIMSGVKTAAADGRRRTRMRWARPAAVAAACLVVIAAVVLGVPRLNREGDGAAIMNSTASANGVSADMNDAAPSDTAPSGGAGNDTSAEQNVPSAAPDTGSTGDTTSEDKADSSGGNENDTPDEEAEEEPDPEETEEPIPDLDIAESVVTVESEGNSVSEKLNREDTLIWLRAVIEGRAGGIRAAKVEIHRFEGKDYDVFIFHDGPQLMGSLSEDLDNAVALNRFADFAVFEETVDSVETVDGVEPVDGMDVPDSLEK